jgi:hypothetical protein
LKVKVRKIIAILTIVGVLSASYTNAQSDGKDDAISPQLWSNLFVGWNITDKVSLRNTLSYNILINAINPWNELTYSIVGVYEFHRFMEVSGGLYFARTEQITNLNSLEYRPFAGFRIFTNNRKRWLVTNLSRLEVRNLVYSDRTSDIALRFRNRTYAGVSLIKPTMVADRNLILYGYFEAFYNFNQEVRERFFNQFKYKMGFAYRHSFRWRFDLGFMYQDAAQNVDIPTTLPRNEITNWVFDWTVAYIIPVKSKD